MKISKKLRTLLITLGIVTSAGAWVYTLMHAQPPQPTEETETATTTNTQNQKPNTSWNWKPWQW